VIEFIRQALIPVGGAAALVSLPGVIELLLVTSGAVRRRSLPDSTRLPEYSLAVIVPAHNEQALIGRCVESLLQSASSCADAPRCSVVVVADNCTDATAERARQAGARVLVRNDLRLRGKGYALRYAFDTLMPESFDAFLVVDADSIVTPNLIPEIVRGLLAGADAVQARYRVTRPLDTDSKRLMDVALLAFTVLRPRGRDGWGLSAGILGNGFALSRDTLAAVPYSADSIVEDLEYHLLLVDAKRRVRFADAATVYGDMPTDSQAQVSQRARWEGGRARVAALWIPKLISRILHGNLFVIEPLIELLTLPLAYLALVALLLCALPIHLFRFYGLFVIALLAVHVFSSIALGGDIRESLRGLASAPAYIFWKLARIGDIIRSARPETQWVRTARTAETKEKVPHV
jgi:cellulose synthase/poly-beta-1,6-N-acetylglucosamine synthase-like glycosyltransferase